MLVILNRWHSDNESTIGSIYVDGRFVCYILEDQFATKKIWGEMRIPAGRFDIVYRKSGGFHERYSKRFPGIHKGMLCIKNEGENIIRVGDIKFQYVLIHIGNTDDDTAGCLLTGSDISGFRPWKVSGSTEAYKKLYLIISEALDNGENVEILINDWDHEREK